MRLKAMIWDVDGTLVDSEELHRHSFNKAFEELGFDWRWDLPTYTRLLEVTGGKERMRHYARMSGIDEVTLPVSIEDAHAKKTLFYREGVCAGALPLRAGVESVLRDALEKGIRLAIATTTTLDNVEALFESSTLNRRDWEIIVAGDQVRRKKPAPDVYLEALKRLELKSWECLAVEDSENGLKSASKAAVPTVITPNAYTCHQRFDEAIALIDNLGSEVKSQGDGGRSSFLEYFEAWHAAAVVLSR